MFCLLTFALVEKKLQKENLDSIASRIQVQKFFSAVDVLASNMNTGKIGDPISDNALPIKVS